MKTYILKKCLYRLKQLLHLRNLFFKVQTKSSTTDQVKNQSSKTVNKNFLQNTMQAYIKLRLPFFMK